MGITVLQLNISNFNRLKYTLNLEIHKQQPDLILLNETGKVNLNQLKIRGYNSMGKNNIEFHGVAIFIKTNFKFEPIPLKENGIIAIKVLTTMGEIIFCTAYCPPRESSLPIISLNRIFSYNLPTLLIADLNAHHAITDNLGKRKYPDSKGKQLHNLIIRRNLNYLGPNFSTYVSRRNKGKPDIAISNNSFLMFNYNIEQGNDIGSDHLPIVMKIQVQPFLFTQEVKANIQTLNISNYKNELKSLTVNEIENNPKEILDVETDRLMYAIDKATIANCNPHKIHKIQLYEPTTEIKNKIGQYQTLVKNYYQTGIPRYYVIQNLLDRIIDLIKNHTSSLWKKIVEIACECYGNPAKFWNRYRRLIGRKKNKVTYLKKKKDNTNNDEEQYESIINQQEQANYMSSIWDEVFTENTGDNFINDNTRMVETWYDNISNTLHCTNIIKIQDLPTTHPLRRPINIHELNTAIKYTKDKTPGPSNISLKQIKYLPLNCKEIMVNIYNGIISTKYYPLFTRKINMIFIHKPEKDLHDPKSYRPICLLELFIKLFEKIIAQRLLYFLEYNNILTEQQFGFRANRSCNQVITLIKMAIESQNSANRGQKKSILICTRDVEKAFDKIHFKSLLFKLNNYLDNDLEFLTLIHKFLINREITPIFNGHKGSIINPRAGVPQGSSLGPVLFLIYVNDLPPPLFDDTIITQYADDLVHIVFSDGKNYKRKARQVKEKMELELKRTKEWEENWKIKTNVEKTIITPIGINKQTIDKIGGIQIDNKILNIKPSAKILGYTLSNRKNDIKHINNIVRKAKNSLNRIRRFKTAPSKIKLTLYKMIVRPILELPPFELTKISIRQKRKIQVVQNDALRFVLNIKRSEKKKIIDIHSKLKMEPMNVRIDKLANKMLNKMKDMYFYKRDNKPIVNYKYDEYIIKMKPIRPKSQSLAKKIEKNILKPNFINNPIKNVTTISDWKPPDSILNQLYHPS